MCCVPWNEANSITISLCRCSSTRKSIAWQSPQSSLFKNNNNLIDNYNNQCNYIFVATSKSSIHSVYIFFFFSLFTVARTYSLKVHISLQEIYTTAHVRVSFHILYARFVSPFSYSLLIDRDRTHSTACEAFQRIEYRKLKYFPNLKTAPKENELHKIELNMLWKASSWEMPRPLAHQLHSYLFLFHLIFIRRNWIFIFTLPTTRQWGKCSFQFGCESFRGTHF